MKLTIERSEFIAALVSATSIVQSRVTMPILGNVLLLATEQGLRVTATDLDMRIETGAEANVSQPGGATVSAVKLLGIVKNLSGDRELIIEQKENYLSVSQGRSRFRLDTLPVEDFPEPMQVKNPKSVEFDTSTLLNMLSKTIRSVSAEETRFYLCGVHFHCGNGLLNAVATDGHRLAHVAEPSSLDFAKIILPTRAVNVLIKHAAMAGDVLCSTIGDNLASFNMGGVIFSTKLIDGKFPQYERIIPDNEHTLKTGKEELVAAINRVIVLADGKTKNIKLKSEGEILTVASVGIGQEEAVDAIRCDSTADMEIFFNSKYVLDALSQLKDGIIDLEFGDVLAPCILRQEDNETFVVMPIRG